MLNQVAPITVFDHATLPIRFILQADGIHVYTDGKPELFLPATDVADLAAAALTFYTPPAPAPVPVPDPTPVAATNDTTLTATPTVTT